MAKTWLQIRVDLESGGGADLDPPPGRIFLVGPRHTFAEFAFAIDQGFGRWDLSHLHLFELADGRLIGFPDLEGFGGPPTLDHEALKVTREVAPGDAFTYVFDLGDDWRHRCTVLPDKVDPREEFGGAPPPAPMPTWGWGWIPDQYGRERYQDLE
jgi:pRiA4b ORF-3-like protein